MLRRHVRSAVALVTSIAILGACSGDSGDGSGVENDIPMPDIVRVAVAMYPLEEIVGRVGGDRVEIIRITPPGVNSHDVEMSAKMLDQLASADVVFYLGDGFQPRVEDAIEELPDGVRTIDMLQLDEVSMPDATTDDHSHAGEDPHVWLDPANMIVMTRAVQSALTEEIGDDLVAAAAFAANADGYIAELSALDDDVTAGLGTCATSTVVTSHEAFGHLFARLGLDHVSITGLDPAEQPSAQQLNEVAEVARGADVTTIFVDATVSARFAETIASEIGASVEVLDPVESLSESAIDAGATYVSVQRDNLRALADGLGCR